MHIYYWRFRGSSTVCDFPNLIRFQFELSKVLPFFRVPSGFVKKSHGHADHLLFQFVSELLYHSMPLISNLLISLLVFLFLNYQLSFRFVVYYCVTLVVFFHQIMKILRKTLKVNEVHISYSHWNLNEICINDFAKIPPITAFKKSNNYDIIY